MKGLIVSGTVLAAMLLSLSTAPSPARSAKALSARRVQLIPMSQSGSQTAEGASSTADRNVAGALDLDATQGGGFAMLNLHRRWVEQEMRSDFAAAALLNEKRSMTRAELDPADPFAWVGVAPIGRGADQGLSASTVTRGSEIAVPTWMRTAPLSFSSAPRHGAGCGASSYRPAGFLSQATEARRQTYYAMMSDIACQYGVPVGLFDALVLRESRYNPYAISPKSAYGLTQLMPGTAAGLNVDRYDIIDNLRGGAKYLRDQLDRFGHAHLALAAYNAGPGRVRGGRVPRIAETQAYVAGILSDWSRLDAYKPTLSDSGNSTMSPANWRRLLRREALVSTY